MANGSLVNILLGNDVSVTPVVGMGATLCLHTDRHAYTITRVSESGKTLWARRDLTRRIDSNGMSESQTYIYAEDSRAPEECFRLSKRGWGKGRFHVGSRREYHDFSF